MPRHPWFLVGATFLVTLGSCVDHQTSGGPGLDGGPSGDAFVPFDGAPIPTFGACSFQACGGQIIGTWQYQGPACVTGEDEAVKKVCTLHGYELLFQTTGTLIFGFDNIYANNLERAAGGTIVLGAGCFPGGVAITREQCLRSADGLGSVTSCALDGKGGCVCTFSDAPARVRTEGIYYASGGELMLDKDALEYCVRGNVLTIRAPYDAANNMYVVYTLIAQ